MLRSQLSHRKSPSRPFDQTIRQSITAGCSLQSHDLSPRPIESIPGWPSSDLCSTRSNGFDPTTCLASDRRVLGNFFVLYRCWLTAACFSEDSLLLTVASLCGFVLLLTGMRYFASRRLKQVLSTSSSLSADQRPGNSHTPRLSTMTEFWLPRTKISFALLLCLAVLFIYLKAK